MTSDKDHFYLTNLLDAYEGQVQYYKLGAKNSPRDGVEIYKKGGKAQPLIRLSSSSFVTSLQSQR
jgi:hypothetical protein